MANSTVLSIDPNFLLLDTYSVSDENLISNQEITSTFNSEVDYVEYYVYGLNNTLLSPSLEDGTIPYTLYSLLNNELFIDPSLDLQTYGFEQGSYNVLYNFYSNRLASSFNTKYFISEISSDRTELRLDSNDIEDVDIISSVNDFIIERLADQFYPDFLLNFGSNRTVIANNIALDGNTVLIKLYEPLPPQFGLKSTLWVVEEVSSPIAYNITFDEEILEEEDTSIQLKGPNVNLSFKDEINNSTEAVSLSKLDSSPLTSSFQQLQSLFNEEGIQINVDYTEYSNFINFSSIESRLENFEYKLQLIENYQNSALSGSNVSGTMAVSGSRGYYEGLVNDIIKNFDGYEYFLYFTSGSKSWPKSNTEPPYQNLSTTNQNSINWYDEQITSASIYDELNQDNLYYNIPEYLRNDPQNQNYINFVEMIGQHFDNIWIYLKDISNKYNADNRINAGISKDLVAQTLRDFSLKIYQNNFSSNDVYSSFLGLTPSGSLFPFPNITGSLPTPEGFEYVNTFISSSNDAIPLDDINKRIYKRLYHNLPYLFKSKGTISGLKTLLNTYGIPDTILRISEFGGKDKINTNDYDYWYNTYNYKFDNSSPGDNISTDWILNSAWGAPDDRPSTLQFRFNAGLYSSSLGIAEASQSLWHNNTNQRIVLEYDTDLATKPTTFSGSILNPEHQYADLKFTPDGGNYATIRLPFLDGGWWNVQVTRDGTDFTLWAANKIYSGSDGTQIGFFESSSISGNDAYWKSNGTSNFPSQGGGSTGGYEPFRGSYQEIRYYSQPISESVFKDYVMNPLSFEGNSIASGSLDKSPDELAFRATLGGELYTGSTSIHPKVAGPWETTSSFSSNSNFTITGGGFSSNKEYIFLDQPAVGIKNRINDKIRSVDLSLPTYTTTEGALIPDANTLSNQRSVQQDKFRNSQYTNNIDLLEVTFSPQNEINDDIIGQLGYFNIGDLIGDPREISSSNQSYPELDKLRQDYFLKYVHENYDFNDYVRLIKFFDNSLFKMIKDFIPARTSLASGITIKPTILERQKYPLPQAEWEDLQYSGSVKSFARDYETGSLQVTSGGRGGSFSTLYNLSNFTQSWSGSYTTPSGSVSYIQSDAPEFINGEFSGSTLLISNGELNTECEPFKKSSTNVITFDIGHGTFNSEGTLKLPDIQLPFAGPSPSFINNAQSLPSGDISIWWEASRSISILPIYDRYTDRFEAKYMAISKTSKNGVDLTSIIPNVTTFNILTGQLSATIDPFQVYSPTPQNRPTNLELEVLDITEYSDSYLIKIKPFGGITIRMDRTSFDPTPVPYPLVISAQNNIHTVLNPYIEGNFVISDCNPIYGVATDIRPGTLYQDIDYSSTTTTPVNFDALIEGNATKANVPDSNYSTKRITKPRYEGSRSTSNDFNLNSNEGGLGSLPNVEQDRAYFVYFNWVGGTSPEWGNGLEDRSALSIRYFVDSEGNVIEPTNDSNGVNLSITRQTFTEGETGVLSFDDEGGTSARFSNLLGEQTIFKSGKKIIPIIYSQTESISDTTTGGYTGSLTFVQGDQAESTVDDYRLTVFAQNQIITSTGNVTFQTPTVLGSEASFSSNTYAPTTSPSTPTPPTPQTTLNFKVFIEKALTANATATFQLQKNSNGAGWVNFGPSAQLDASIDDSITIQTSDATALSTDDYRLRITSQNSAGQGNLLEIKATSYLRVQQTPPPSIGAVGPNTPGGTNYWTKLGTTTNQFRTNALTAVLGQKQQDISSSGFSGITTDFNLEVGDEIRFQGTETQTYKITAIDVATNPSYVGALVYTVDRNISLTNTEMNWFLVRRYIDTPGQIIIEADKPAGGTSPGFFMPLYATKGIEDNFDKVIQQLKTDQLI